jgi:hypothetical protein
MADDRENVRHDVELGWKRLYHAPKDVRDAVNLLLKTPKHVVCPDAMQLLLESYREQMGWAVEQALDWWRSIVETEQSRSGGSLHDAALRAYDTWPAGPAANEMVVSTVRRYWLAADKAGRTARPEILPEDFLLASLDRTSDARIILVLTGMPYWPIGIDENGNWC